MLPYLLVLSLVMFWITLEQTTLKRKAFWVPLLILTLFAGVRSYQVGTDSGTYTIDFYNEVDASTLDFSEGIEIGYQLLHYALLSVTHNYFWLFFITGFIVVFCYLKVIRDYSVDYGLSVLLFFTLGSYLFFFNGLRQGLAMAIFALAMRYLLEKRFLYYLLICCLAALFHATALFMIPFYFIVNLRIKPIYKIVATFLISLVGSRPLVAYVASQNERYESYTEVAEQTGGLITLGFHIVIMIVIFLFNERYEIKTKYFDKLYTFYAVGVVFTISLALLQANPSGPQRLFSYFTWTLVLIIPMVLKRINNAYIYLITIVLATVYFILTTNRFSNLSPYLLNPIFEVF